MLPLLLCLCRSFGIVRAKVGGEDEYVCDSGLGIVQGKGVIDSTLLLRRMIHHESI